MNLKKLGLLTTTTLLSVALLTSCKSDEETPAVTDTPTTTPSVGAGSSTTGSTESADTEDGVADLGLDMPEEDEGEESESEGDEDISTEPATPPEGEAGDSDAKLSSPDVTLTEAGATYKLTVSGTSVSGVSYSSDNTAVATVANDGTVTAVSTGNATITVKFTTSSGKSQSLGAVIRCDIPEPEPELEVTPEPEATPEPEVPEVETPSATSVDLSGFYNSMSSAHSFGSMEPVTGDFLSNFFPGISGVSTNQQHIYMAMMTSSAVEIALVEVSNGSDVDTVKGIFQSRINSQVDGGAWYPETIESWKNTSRVVSNGNYVMMIVHPNCDAIVSSFNGLF